MNALLSAPVAALAAVLSLPLQAAAPVPVSPAGPVTTADDRFGALRLHRPSGTPTALVLYLSGEAGWSAHARGGAAAIVEALVADGALVAAIDTPRLLRRLEADGAACLDLAADFERLGQRVQAQVGSVSGLRPIVAGHGAGATLAYGALAQASAGTFAGALNTAFCPDLNLSTPLCPGQGLRIANIDPEAGGLTLLPGAPLSAPWLTLHGEVDQVCAVETVRQFVADQPQARVLTLPKVGHAFATPADWTAALQAARLALWGTQTAAGKTAAGPLRN